MYQGSKQALTLVIFKKIEFGKTREDLNANFDKQANDKSR
jgi:hypothetical protein